MLLHCRGLFAWIFSCSLVYLVSGTCTKWTNTDVYHPGTNHKVLQPWEAPNGVEWQWKQCAQQCALFEGVCDFWTLHLSGSRTCTLKSAKGTPIANGEPHFEGAALDDCSALPCFSEGGLVHLRGIDIRAPLTNLSPHVFGDEENIVKECIVTCEATSACNSFVLERTLDRHGTLESIDCWFKDQMVTPDSPVNHSSASFRTFHRCHQEVLYMRSLGNGECAEADGQQPGYFKKDSVSVHWCSKKCKENDWCQASEAGLPGATYCKLFVDVSYRNTGMATPGGWHDHCGPGGGSRPPGTIAKAKTTQHQKRCLQKTNHSRYVLRWSDQVNMAADSGNYSFILKIEEETFNDRIAVIFSRRGVYGHAMLAIGSSPSVRLLYYVGVPLALANGSALGDAQTFDGPYKDSTGVAASQQPLSDWSNCPTDYVAFSFGRYAVEGAGAHALSNLLCQSVVGNSDGCRGQCMGTACTIAARCVYLPDVRADMGFEITVDAGEWSDYSTCHNDKTPIGIGRFKFENPNVASSLLRIDCNDIGCRVQCHAKRCTFQTRCASFQTLPHHLVATNGEWKQGTGGSYSDWSRCPSGAVNVGVGQFRWKFDQPSTQQYVKNIECTDYGCRVRCFGGSCSIASRCVSKLECAIGCDAGSPITMAYRTETNVGIVWSSKPSGENSLWLDNQQQGDVSLNAYGWDWRDEKRPIELDGSSAAYWYGATSKVWHFEIWANTTTTAFPLLTTIIPTPGQASTITTTTFSSTSSTGIPAQAANISCTVKVDDFVWAVYYNNIDITTTVSGDLQVWDAEKNFSITPVLGAYLAIYGEDVDSNFGGNHGGGFWADCGIVLPSSTLLSNWESYCTVSVPDSSHQAGSGNGWTSASFNSGKHGWLPGTLGDVGKGYCVFRAIPYEAPVNLALGKPASSSSTAYNGLASKATDGQSNNGNYVDAISGVCAHTENKASWIKVDLQASKTIDSVSLVGRRDCCAEQSSGWTIYVGDAGNTDDAVCAINVDASGGSAISISCASKPSGRYITVSSSKWIVLCELEAYGSEASTCIYSSQPGNPSGNYRRCGTCCGGSDTTSAMCTGATVDGRLHVSEAEMQARCTADTACAGYGKELNHGYYRPVTQIPGTGSATHWETYTKTCQTTTTTTTTINTIPMASGFCNPEFYNGIDTDLPSYQSVCHGWTGTYDDAKSMCLSDNTCTGVYDFKGDAARVNENSAYGTWRYCSAKPQGGNPTEQWLPKNEGNCQAPQSWTIVFEERVGDGNGMQSTNSDRRTLNYNPLGVFNGSYWVRLEWGSSYIQFFVPSGSNIFNQSQPDFNIPVEQVTTSKDFSPNISGAAYFCHACVKDGDKYGHTCWAITPLSDTHRSCGCSATSFLGEGIYYGGEKTPDHCTDLGGGFAGPRTIGQTKGGVPSIGLRFLIHVPQADCGIGYVPLGTLSRYEYCVNYAEGSGSPASSLLTVSQGFAGVADCRQQCDADPTCTHFAKYGAYCDGLCHHDWKKKCFIIRDCGGTKHMRLPNAGMYGAVVCKKVHPRCTWTSTINGKISGHNLLVELGVPTIESCKSICERNASCKSIEYADYQGTCHLNYCQIGDGMCTKDIPIDFQYSSCVEAEPIYRATSDLYYPTSTATACESEFGPGSMPAEILDSSQQALLEKSIDFSGTGTFSENQYYIGAVLADTGNAAEWKWLSGHAMHYENWNTGQGGVNPVQPYAGIGAFGNGGWGNYGSVRRFKVLCQEKGCSKWDTTGWHEGTRHRSLPPTDAPDGQDWTWQQCADRCARLQICEFWTLRRTGNRHCLLMANKGVFHVDATMHLEGPRNFACLEDNSQWIEINRTAACENNAEGIQRTSGHNNTSLDDCKLKCMDSCVAIDFYTTTNWCNLYDTACTTPQSTKDGATSWKRQASTPYNRIEQKECFETPYTYNLSVGCDGWSGLTETLCWEKCVGNAQAPSCPQQSCVAMKFNQNSGWCHLYSFCASLKNSQDSDAILRMQLTTTTTAVTTPSTTYTQTTLVTTTLVAGGEDNFGTNAAYVAAACSTATLDANNKAGFVPMGSSAAGIQCCSLNASSCKTIVDCPAHLTYAEAREACESDGRRLCTREEMLSGICCGVEGNCDSQLVWTSTHEDVTVTTTTLESKVLTGRLTMTVNMADDFVKEKNMTRVITDAIALICNVSASWVHDVSIRLVLERFLASAVAHFRSLGIPKDVEVEWKIVIPPGTKNQIEVHVIAEKFDAKAISEITQTINDLISTGGFGNPYTVNVTWKYLLEEGDAVKASSSTAPSESYTVEIVLVIIGIVLSCGFLAVSIRLIFYCRKTQRPSLLPDDLAEWTMSDDLCEFAPPGPKRSTVEPCREMTRTPSIRNVARKSTIRQSFFGARKGSPKDSEDGMDSKLSDTYSLFTLLYPPDAVTIDQGRDLRRLMQQIQRDSLGHKAEVYLSYTPGQRCQDGEGVGPGTFYAAAVLKKLHESGVDCYSELMIPEEIGDSRSMFCAQLSGRFTSCKVLIVLLTRPLFECRDTLREIYTAQESDIELLPLRFEKDLPLATSQWPDITRNDLQGMLMVSKVQEKFCKLNTTPSPPHTVPDQPMVLEEIAADLKAKYGANEMNAASPLLETRPPVLTRTESPKSSPRSNRSSARSLRSSSSDLLLLSMNPQQYGAAAIVQTQAAVEKEKGETAHLLKVDEKVEGATNSGPIVAKRVSTKAKARKSTKQDTTDARKSKIRATTRGEAKKETEIDKSRPEIRRETSLNHPTPSAVKKKASCVPHDAGRSKSVVIKGGTSNVRTPIPRSAASLRRQESKDKFPSPRHPTSAANQHKKEEL